MTTRARTPMSINSMRGRPAMADGRPAPEEDTTELTPPASVVGAAVDAQSEAAELDDAGELDDGDDELADDDEDGQGEIDLTAAINPSSPDTLEDLVAATDALAIDGDVIVLRLQHPLAPHQGKGTDPWRRQRVLRMATQLYGKQFMEVLSLNEASWNRVWLSYVKALSGKPQSLLDRIDGRDLVIARDVVTLVMAGKRISSDKPVKGSETSSGLGGSRGTLKN